MTDQSTMPPQPPKKKSWLDPGQLDAGLRHLGTAAATGGTIVAALGLLSADEAHAVVDKLQDVGTHVKAIMGDLSAIWVIVGPVAAVWMGKMAASSASLRNQLKSVTSNPIVQVQGKIVVSDPAVAAAVPSPKVVAPGDNLAK